MPRHFLLTASLTLALLEPSAAMAADWMQFRGPGGTAVGPQGNLPAEWSPEQNLIWQTPLPGLGTSSPVTVDQRVFVTCYSGYGQDSEDPGTMDQLTRHVVCLDRETGSILWKRDFQPQLPESDYSGGNNTWHGYSSSTPATDGQRLYVFFGISGVYCLDLNGQTLWHAEVGSGTRGWGSAASPVLVGDHVIINASVESQSLVALDKNSGNEVWRTEGIQSSWCTPLVVPLRDGARELVISVPDKVLGFDPVTGEELWWAEGIPDRYVCPSAVAHEGIVYAIGGRQNTALAVRAGGRGDVSQTHVLWRTRKGSNVTSPVYYDGHLYWIHETRGIAYCLQTDTGKVVYEERLTPRPGRIYASGIAADGKLYYVTQHNGVFVLEASPHFKLLAHNALDDSRANASPAVSRNALLVRTDRFLYCLGQGKK